MLVGLVLTKQRKIFSNWHLYFSALIAALIFLPTFLWEYNRHFPVMVHMKELHDTQLKYIDPAGFLKDQILMNIPCFFIWVAGLCFIIFHKQGKKYLAFALGYLFVIVLMIWLHGKNYYTLGVYPTLFAFGAYYLESLTAQRFRTLRYVMVIIPFMLGTFFIPMALPVAKPKTLASYYQKFSVDKTGILKWEDLQNHALPQDFADMTGWEEICEKVANAYKSLDSNERKRTILFCDNYGQAGAVNYYRNKYKLPEAYSDNGSFLYWMPRYQHIDNLILITDDKQEMQHAFIKNFTSAVAVDSVTNVYAREQGTLIIIFKGANEEFNNTDYKY